MSRTVPPYPQGRSLLAGKTAVITAAAGTGIGFWTARRFAEEGATLFLSDLHARRLDETADKLAESTGERPATALCDVTNQAQVDALRDSAIAALGHVDVLVNNAGLGGTAHLVEMTDAQWSRVLDVTLNGTMRVTRAFLPHMLARGQGAIVNNASVLGWRAQPGQSHYAAAKAGVMAFTRCVALEAAARGVRVNAVAPSLAMHEFLSRVTPDGLLEELEKREAFGRAAAPFEVANVMVFLASDYASYMTGEIVAVSSQHP
jgi:3-oxoacyl-[acyl-carrier protein] reductase